MAFRLKALNRAVEGMWARACARVVPVSSTASKRGSIYLNGFKDIRTENASSQGQIMALTGVFVPSSLNSGWNIPPQASSRQMKPGPVSYEKGI